MADSSPRPTAEWRIANASLVKIVATIALVYLVVKLVPFLVLVAFAILVACALYPAMQRLERYLPHWAAVLIVTIGVIAGLAALLLVAIPSLSDQLSAVAKRLPELQSRVEGHLPRGPVGHAVRRLFENPGVSSEHVLAFGGQLFGALTALVLIMALALYLAADGRRTYAWLVAYFSPEHRRKIDATAGEMFELIVAYVVGQVITSALCGLFVFTVLTALRVPAALVLAFLAAIFDVLPMLGFFLFTIPAVLFAFSVSGNTALTVLVLYPAYHLLENYVIVPKIYGSRLRLSDLVVLTSVLAGAYLGGIAGAVLILPLVAAYPAFERIWLVKYVGPDVVKKHEAVENRPS